MKNLFAISTISFAFSASILAAHDAMAEPMKMQEPKAAYASLSYASVDGISAPKATFGIDVNRYVSGQVSYLQSGQGKPDLHNNKLSYRSLEANLIARPFADVIDPNLVQPYLKAGVASDTTALKTGELITGMGPTNQLREKTNTAFVFGGGVDLPLSHFSKDLFLTADYSRHEYFATSAKPVNTASIGLKAKY